MAIYERQTKNKGLVFDIAIRQNGKKVWYRNAVPGGNRAAAERKERQLLSQVDKGVDIKPSKFTLRVYLEDWLRDYAAGKGGQTPKTYDTNLRVHVIGRCFCTVPDSNRPLPVDQRHTYEDRRRCSTWSGSPVAEKKLTDLKPADIQTIYGRIIAHRSRKTALNVHRVLSEALRHAVRLEVIGRNVCDSVLPPQPQKYRVIPPSIAEAETLLLAADRTRFGALCRCAAWTGLRQGELLRLKWGDIDLAGGVLYVREQAKWGSEGALVLPAEAVDILIAHRIEEQAKMKALHGGPESSFVFKNEYVFTNELGRQQDAGKLKLAWKNHVKGKTGLRFRFHDLRHFHASALIRAGLHPKVIQERLRHRNITTTMDTYGHLMAGLQQDAADRISAGLRDALAARREE